MDIVGEYLSNLGLDIIKSWCQQRIDENRLKRALESYIVQQHKYNNLYSMSEEVDWQALINYMTSNLVEIAVIRVFDPIKKKRENARLEIINRVVAVADVESEESRKLVARFTCDCLDIIRSFCQKSLSIRDYVLADMVVDGVAGEIQSAKEDIIKQINHSKSLFSLDTAMNLADSNEFLEIGDGVKKVLMHVSQEHPCFPYYGFSYNDGVLISKPIRDDATMKYPPRLQITGNVKLGDAYNKGDPFDYSYRHQIPIQMEVKEAKKLLGDILDPDQNEAKDLIGNTITIYPPKFPPQFPCAIKVGDETFYDYILLRTQEIRDDEVYVVGNREQDGDLYFEICIDPNNQRINRFSFKFNKPTNREFLRLARFRRALMRNNDLHIYMLSKGKDFLAGKVSEPTYTSAFESIEEEIDFLERVCEIEDYYKVALNLNQEIAREVFNTIYYISELIRNEEVCGTWDELIIPDKVTHDTRNELLSKKGVIYSVKHVFIGTMDLLGATLKFKVQRTMNEVVVADYDKLMNKIEVLDVGDEIKIKLKPGKDNRATDTIHFSDEKC